MSARAAVRERADAPATPHPRFRERRADVARAAGHKRLRRLKAVLAVICAVVWALVGLRSSVLDVDRVQVVGSSHTPEADVRAAVATPTGTPMVEVDLGAIEGRVAALPWVAEVRASRLWPGTVRLVVTERAAVAVVAHPGGWALVDVDGRVLEVADDAPDLPVVAGRRTQAPGAQLPASDRPALAVAAALPEDLAAEVVELRTDDDGLVIELDDGYTVVVGDASEVAAKAAAADAVRQHAEPDPDRCRIDARVPSAPVLTEGSGCA